MTIVGLVVHQGREAAVAAAEGLRRHLEARGVSAHAVSGASLAGGPTVEDGGRDLDLVVSVGGDGTFLRAAWMAAASGACPVLGVKVGRVGFLTEVTPEEAPALLDAAIEGRVRIEERLAVLAEPGDGRARFESQWALNEIMVEKGTRHRLIRLALRIGGSYVTTFSADGVIVATPTGSTAYSFSARGPIVTPTLRSVLVTPIAAHMVFDRSFVLGADERVELEVVGEEPGLLSADGREAMELPVGAQVRIGAAPEPARLVRRDDAPSFLTLVRDKFGLPGEPDVGRGR